MFDFFYNKISEKVSDSVTEHVKEEIPKLMRENIGPAMKEVASEMIGDAFEETVEFAITTICPYLTAFLLFRKGMRFMRHVKVIRQLKQSYLDDYARKQSNR